MINNFERYFLHEKKVFLDNISYETVKTDIRQGEMKLNCKDTIVAQLSERGVKINFNRAMTFQPEGIFSLSVTFGVMLVFDPSTREEVDWKGEDVAGEFRRSCPQLMTVLMSRASTLIAMITSSAGQNPIVTPAAPAPRENQNGAQQ